MEPNRPRFQSKDMHVFILLKFHPGFRGWVFPAFIFYPFNSFWPIKKLCMCHLGREETEALNEANEGRGFLSPKCLPGKLYAVHSWTKIEKNRKKVWFFSIVQDTTPSRAAHWSGRGLVWLLSPHSAVWRPNWHQMASMPFPQSHYREMVLPPRVWKGTEWDFGSVLCRARSWTQWSLWVPSSHKKKHLFFLVSLRHMWLLKADEVVGMMFFYRGVLIWSLSLHIFPL